MITKSFAAIATAAVIAVGTIATAAPAQAGHHHGGFVIKFKGHGYGHGPYWGGYGYGCYYKNVQVWTYYGPEWVTKKVCH